MKVIRENEIEFLERLYNGMFSGDLYFDLWGYEHPTATLWEGIDEDVQTIHDNWEGKIAGWVAIARAHDFEVFIEVVSYDHYSYGECNDVYVILKDVRVR